MKTLEVDVRITAAVFQPDSLGELQALNVGYDVFRVSDGELLGHHQRQFTIADLQTLGLTGADKTVVENALALARDAIEADL